MRKMMIFTKFSKMADVILTDYRLVSIIARFGVGLGFGNKSVGEVCNEHKVDVDFFLEIVNSYHNSNYFPENQLRTFQADLIIEYLSKTHAYYLNSKIPKIELCIQKMEQGTIDENSRNVGLLRQFFQEYKVEIEQHFNLEEDKVFPYILLLEEVLVNGNYSDELIERIKKEPIEIYERNHDSLEIKLGDLKNLIIRFLPPVLEDLSEQLLMELFRMESDLEDHARIEEKVLVPKVKLLEQKVLEICGIF